MTITWADGEGECGHPLREIGYDRPVCRVCGLLDGHEMHKLSMYRGGPYAAGVDHEGYGPRGIAPEWRGREAEANAWMSPFTTGVLPPDVVSGIESGRHSLTNFLAGYVGHTARSIPTWNERREAVPMNAARTMFVSDRFDMIVNRRRGFGFLTDVTDV